MTKKKILALIYRKKNNILEFLALRNNPDPIHGGGFYYVVTGGVEAGEDPEDAVKREIREETGIEKILNIQNTGKIYKYTHPGEGDYLCKEYCYLIEIDDEVHHLNEEHIEYKWLKKDDFINTLDWYGDKKDLKELLNMLKK